MALTGCSCGNDRNVETEVDISEIAVEISDAFCVPLDSSEILFKFNIDYVGPSDIETKYFWSLNDPKADGPGFAQGINDPLARVYQGQGSVVLRSSEGTDIEIRLDQIHDYDPRFYRMYIDIYLGDELLTAYRAQKSTYDWDYSVLPPVYKADKTDTVTTTDAYDFPIKPGMDQWYAFTSHDEMLNVCQIPNTILKNMSTAGLVETVSKYPLLIDMWAYNDVQTGFEAVTSQFNGIAELLSRDDAATEILAKYRSLDIAEIKGKETLEIAEYALRTVAFTEILLAQDTIIDKMDKDERTILVSEAIEKDKIKQQFPEIYGGLGGREYTTRIMARVMQHENFAPFMQKIEESDSLQTFIATGSFARVALMDEITLMAQEFLSQA